MKVRHSMKKGIVAILSTLAGTIIGIAAAKKIADKAVDKASLMSDKHLALFLLMNRWVQAKQEGKSLTDYFDKHMYRSIAIYGMSYAGERLMDEVKDSGITVKYGIDKNADAIYADIDILSPDEQLEEVDAVVVTPVFFIDEIEKVLAEKISCPIISLEDILYDI